MATGRRITERQEHVSPALVAGAAKGFAVLR